jgi:glyoxylase-like metal-dependent hydrolase (beta-lactamase superfamily II)
MMAQQIPVDDQALHGFGVRDEAVRELAPDLAYRRLGIVNVVFFGRPGGDWVLIDADLPDTVGMIAGSAGARFGDRAPLAVVLTHGHINHVGGLRTLAERWSAPVYAHLREVPYLNGTSAHPKPGTHVGGGAMTLQAPRQAMRGSLHRLAAQFERVAVPEAGECAYRPAIVGMVRRIRDAVRAFCRLAGTASGRSNRRGISAWPEPPKTTRTTGQICC